MSAVGGLLASVFVAPIAGSRRALPVYAAGGVLTGLSLVLVGLTPTFLLVFGPMFLMGLGTGAFQTLNSAVIVTESAPQYYGRVISQTSMAFGAFMLASLPVGLAADAFGERATLIVIGLLIIPWGGNIHPVHDFSFSESAARLADTADEVFVPHRVGV